MMDKPWSNRAWFLVIPVLVVVLFSSLLPMMTVLNYSVQDAMAGNTYFWNGDTWFRDLLNPATEIGAMITAEHRARVLGYVAKGAAEGARLVTGGAALADRPGFWVQPALFDGVTPTMTIAREEIFGPLLGVMSCASPEEALHLAADTEYGLHATIFTRDIDRAISLARRIPAGTVAINKFTEGDIKTPFGGYRKSGSLTRDNGTEAIEQYLQTKTIWIEIADAI